MKHLLTLSLLAILQMGWAQSEYCLSDINVNGLCDEEEVLGCSYPLAENYDPEATFDNSACVFADGCPTDCGFIYDGNNDGAVGSADLLDLLAEFSQACLPETTSDTGSNSGSWNVVGTADPNGASCVQLTAPFIVAQTGAAWHDCQIHLGFDFDLEFTVNLGGDPSGADGMCFVLHQEGNTGSNLVGGNGSDIGYGEGPFGPTSIAIEIDTYANYDLPDPWFDHIAINSGGFVDHNLSPAVQADENSGNIEIGQNHPFRVTWNSGSNTLEVFFNDVLRQTLTLDLTANIFNGDPVVNWGWTGATGGLANDHSFCLVDASYSSGGTCECLGDFNMNGICDNAEVLGCTYENAINFDPFATIDDGSCEDPSGCEDPCGLAYDGDNDGLVGMGDFLGLLSEFGDTCESVAAASCGNPVNYQGYDYATVLIGDQCWFAENLRNELYNNGDTIPAGLSGYDWWSTTLGAISVFGEGEQYLCLDQITPDGNACDEAWALNEFGRLYNWHAVDDARGLCPSGWHVPTDGEWTVMTDHLGGESIAGSQMKTTYGWLSDGNGTNSSGFSGLPGGTRMDDGNFILAGLVGDFWSSSPSGYDAWYRNLNTNEVVNRFDVNPQFGFSVRCIRD